MPVTKKHKGMTITIINPEAIPSVEERVRKMTAEMIMERQAKELRAKANQSLLKEKP